MTKKQELQQLRWLDSRINANIAERERLQSLAERMTTVYTQSKKQAATKSDRANIIHKMIELDEQICKDIDALVDIKTKILIKLNGVHDDGYRTLLLLRYVNLKTWEEIALEFDRTPRWVQSMHGRALQAYGKSRINTS